MPSRPGRVLIVADDGAWAASSAAMLLEFGFAPQVSQPAPEALLRAARQHAAELALFLSRRARDATVRTKARTVLAGLR